MGTYGGGKLEILPLRNESPKSDQMAFKLGTVGSHVWCRLGIDTHWVLERPDGHFREPNLNCMSICVHFHSQFTSVFFFSSWEVDRKLKYTSLTKAGSFGFQKSQPWPGTSFADDSSMETSLAGLERTVTASSLHVPIWKLRKNDAYESL